MLPAFYVQRNSIEATDGTIRLTHRMSFAVYNYAYLDIWFGVTKLSEKVKSDISSEVGETKCSGRSFC